MGIWDDYIKPAGGAVLGGGVGFLAGEGYDKVKGGLGNAWNQTLGNNPGQDQELARKQNLYGQAAAAGQFADQGQQGFGQLGARGDASMNYLEGQMRGQNSVSAMQLQQALGQNQNAQMSYAAGASPQNAAMAARTGAMQMGRLGAGLAGQQAVAGLQERNQAAGQYGQLLGTLRGQDLQSALGSRQNALTGYGAANAGAPQKSWLEQYGPMITSAAGMAAKG